MEEEGQGRVAADVVRMLLTEERRPTLLDIMD